MILNLVEKKHQDLTVAIKEMSKKDVSIDVYEDYLKSAEIYKDLRNTLRKILKEMDNGNSR